MFALTHFRLKGVAVAFVAAVGIVAPAVAQSPGWTAVSTVVEIVNTVNGGFNVRLSPSLTECTSQSGYGPEFASFYPDLPGISRFKADMLVALTTGARVLLYLSDNTCRAVETRLYAP